MTQLLGSVPASAGPRVSCSSCVSFSPTANRSASVTSPAAWAKASNTGPMPRRNSAGILSNTAAMDARRCSISWSTKERPSRLSARSRYRRSSGLSLRSRSPAATSRSQVRVALEGCTPKSAATAPRFCGPWVSMKTRTRSCGEVTRSSTSATDWATTAMNTRAARIAASISSGESARTAGPGGQSAVTASVRAGSWLISGFTFSSVVAHVQCLPDFDSAPGFQPQPQGKERP